MKRKTIYGLVAGTGLAAILAGVGTDIYEKKNDKNTPISEILYGVGALSLLGGSGNWAYELSASSNKENLLRKKNFRKRYRRYL